MADQQIYFDVQAALGGVDYPATRDELVAAAEGNAADEEVLAILRALPEGTFSDPTQVTEAIAE